MQPGKNHCRADVSDIGVYQAMTAAIGDANGFLGRKTTRLFSEYMRRQLEGGRSSWPHTEQAQMFARLPCSLIDLLDAMVCHRAQRIAVTDVRVRRYAECGRS